MRVVYDKSLSPGARLLYVALDDYAGLKGAAWPHQATLARQLGFSIRQVQRWLDELAAAGRYIAFQRTRHGNRYHLLWQASDAVSDTPSTSPGTPSPHDTPVASHTPSAAPPRDIPVVSHTTPVSHAYKEPDKEPENRSIDRGERLTWMIDVLVDYPGAMAQIGYRPDAAIARDCLEIAGWDIGLIKRAIRETYLRGGRRACPNQSWAWFRTVLRNYCVTAAPAQTVN